jgi:hypothetical protein
MTGKTLTMAMAAMLGLAAGFTTLSGRTVQAAGWTGHFHHHHHGRFRNALYGTYGLPYDYWPSSYALEPVAAAPLPQRIDPVIAAVAGSSCVKSRESITVPSEDGGTRTMMVTRC